MSIAAAEILVAAATLYLAIGLVFALVFVVAGVARVDPRARGATVGFRLLVLPGAAVLWPLLGWRWLRGGGPPEERNAHRRRARRGDER